MKQFKIDNPEKILEIINRIEFFKGLTDAEKQTFAGFNQNFATYEKGDFIIKEGNPDAFFYVLLLGEVYVTKGNPQRPIANLEPGDCFGEISFLSGSPRTANVIADANATVVIRISHEMVHKLDIKIREKLKDKLIKRLVERLDHMNRFAVSAKNQLPESMHFPDDPAYIP